MLQHYADVTAESIASETDTALALADGLVVKAAVAAPSFDATLRPLGLAGAVVADAYGRTAFMAQVHPDAVVRDAGQAAEERLTKWRIGLALREDLYRAVREYAHSDDAHLLTGERKRLLEFWLRDFRRAGQELEPAQRAELKGLLNRMVEIEIAFVRNVNEHEDGIDVTDDQLTGLPDDYIERLKPGDKPGTHRVSLDYPELNPFLEQARDRSLRETLSRKDWNKAVDANRGLLAEAIQHRQRIAALLGKPTWAHHAMEIKMAGRPDRVKDFYARLVPPLQEAARSEMAEMDRLLAADDQPAPVQTWDWRYYDAQQARDLHGVDQNVVSEYLPLDSVMQGMFDLTGEVFGLDFRRVDDANAWHPSVQLFEILDRDNGTLLAHFYADLFPREGKYSHAAAFPLVVGHRRADGSYATPVSAIVANFTPPSGDRPSLLRHGQHGEAETLFHEFGHILHMSLTKAEFTRFSAAETEWDFVEAPSQIMEHWVWDPDVLNRFARHYRTGKPLPRPLAEHMAEARWLNVGMRATRQVWLGLMDLALHTATTTPDMDAIIRDAFGVTGMTYPEQTFYLAGFGHLVGGYDAGYYGYLWAEVIGDDMFGRFRREGVLSPVVGGDYRRAILEPNGSRSADEMLLDFLGRPPSNEAFLHLRGMTAAEPVGAKPLRPGG